MNSGENSDILDKKTNDKKNVPVLVITYFVVIIFICMFAYIIVFMVRDSRTFIANSYNGRQSLYAEKIKKGSIISSDGNVLAETLTDDDGTSTEIIHIPMCSHMLSDMTATDRRDLR